jgi:hypothetical protein
MLSNGFGRSLSLVLGAVLAGVTLFACGTPPAVGDSSNAVAAADATAPTCSATVTLTQVQQDVFTPSCAACHSGPSARAGLDLSAGNSFSNLVNVASTLAPTEMRVVPSNPSTSFLVQKLTGNLTAGQGAQMPLHSTLSAALINETECWVAQGASNN